MSGFYVGKVNINKYQYLMFNTYTCNLLPSKILLLTKQVRFSDAKMCSSSCSSDISKSVMTGIFFLKIDEM